MCYELRSDFSKQLKVIVIVIGNFVIVIVIGKMKCNCNLIVIDKNVIDPCLIQTQSLLYKPVLWFCDTRRLEIMTEALTSGFQIRVK